MMIGINWKTIKSIIGRITGNPKPGKTPKPRAPLPTPATFLGFPPTLDLKTAKRDGLEIYAQYSQMKTASGTATYQRIDKHDANNANDVCYFVLVSVEARKK